MKFLKVFFSCATMFALLSIGGSTFVSCKKTVTVHDTTIRDVHDTTIKNIHDTTVVQDSVYDLKYGLIAYYNFNGGNLNDSSGYGNNIVFNNATKTSDRFGTPNNAYLFDGATNYMRVSNSSTLNPFGITIFAIFKPNGFNTASCHGNQIVGKGYPDYINGFYALRFADLASPCGAPLNPNTEYFGGTYGDNNPNNTYVGADTVQVKIGQWYYVAYTFDSYQSKLYINGVLKAANIKPTAYTVNNHDLFIGMHEDPAFPYLFNGVIDEVRIYNYPLSPATISKLSQITD